MDILVAGNLYNDEVETARNVASYRMLLTGDGTGNFAPLDKNKSGFFVPYNVKSIVPIISINGNLVLVGCNDAAL